MHTSVDGQGYEAAIEMLKDQAYTIAGLHPLSRVRAGRPENNIKKVTRVVNDHSRKDGLIIASAGEMPFDAPTANIRALAHAVASSPSPYAGLTYSPSSGA